MKMELLVFEIAGSRFSLPLDQVEEVVPSSAITPVPNSPPFLLGLASVRGRVMGVIDAALRYGIGPALNSHFLVCRVRGNLTAITIDRPLVAGAMPVRLLNETEYAKLKNACRVDEKFLKSGFELLEVPEENAEPRPTGLFFAEVAADLFVSAEMASRIGEA